MHDRHLLKVATGTHTQLTLLAQAWNTTPGDAVQRLLDSFRTDLPTPGPVPDGVPVYAVYAQHKIHSLFDPDTQSLTLADGPAPGFYKAPSGASAAVLRALNPTVPAIRNGWTFWRLTSNGQHLQTLRRHPPTPRPHRTPTPDTPPPATR